MKLRHRGFSRFSRISKMAHARKLGVVSKCAEKGRFSIPSPKTQSAYLLQKKSYWRKPEFTEFLLFCGIYGDNALKYLGNLNSM